MRLWAVAWHRLLGFPAGGLRHLRWHREVDRQAGEAGDVRMSVLTMHARAHEN